MPKAAGSWSAGSPAEPLLSWFAVQDSKHRAPDGIVDIEVDPDSPAGVGPPAPMPASMHAASSPQPHPHTQLQLQMQLGVAIQPHQQPQLPHNTSHSQHLLQVPVVGLSSLQLLPHQKQGSISPSSSPMSASGSLAPSASKVSKHRRKADTKMPGASSPNAAASMLAAGLPVASSGSASVVSGRPSSRRKRNPYDREASSERKSASPSPSRSAASQAHAAAAAASSSSTSSPANFAKASATSLGTLQPHRTKSALSSLLSQSSAAAAAAAAAAQPRDPSAPDGQAATPAAPPVRQCSYCFATTTPMWRHGPPGYPDLCNKCGVKWMRGRILQDGAALAPTGTTAHLAANLESSAIIASSAPADLAAAAALVGNAAPAVIVIKRSASSSGAPVALNNVATPMDTSEG